MRELGVITEKDFTKNGIGVLEDGFVLRKASRAVLTNDKNEVYLLDVKLHKYHKLPGGGIDEGEDVDEALKRELIEELGAEIEIVKELGCITEYRPAIATWDGSKPLKQISYCYLAKLIGEQAEPSFDAGEIEEGLTEEKARSIEDAIEILKSDSPDNLEGKFIQKRDLTFLAVAEELLSPSS